MSSLIIIIKSLRLKYKKFLSFVLLVDIVNSVKLTKLNSVASNNSCVRNAGHAIGIYLFVKINKNPWAIVKHTLTNVVKAFVLQKKKLEACC